MSTVELDDYEWVTQEDAAKPINGICTVYVDYWWNTDAQGRIAFYNPANRRTGKRRNTEGSPQANCHESVARMIGDRFEWVVGTVQLPVVFRRCDAQDYI